MQEPARPQDRCQDRRQDFRAGLQPMDRRSRTAPLDRNAMLGTILRATKTGLRAPGRWEAGPTLPIGDRGLADGVGFEPTRSANPCRFSRPVPSTARPPIRRWRLLASKSSGEVNDRHGRPAICRTDRRMRELLRTGIRLWPGGRAPAGRGTGGRGGRPGRHGLPGRRTRRCGVRRVGTVGNFQEVRGFCCDLSSSANRPATPATRRRFPSPTRCSS